MRFPLSWLKTLVELPDDLGQVSQLLMRSGVELEAVENAGAGLDQVVVVQVLDRLPHPNADKLSVCKVNDGSRDYSIVCGAPNVAVGLKVPLAKEGAVLPGDFKIKRSKIRGVESEGMLCSAEELGLPKGVDGLLILDAALALGRPLAQALGLDDPVLTVQTTANRPDHLSLRGLAREIAALGSLPLKAGAVAELKAVGESGLNVEIAASACSYYSVRKLQGVRVGPSPDWLKARLERSGIRSISNVVDATNSVLLEYGQPMHAFDAARLSGKQLEARLARTGETLKTLDGQLRTLKPEDLVIADAAGPQALAGVMGGAHSEVSAATTDLVLEAAVFAPASVRRTSRRLGLSSESSQRFERGLDSLAVDEAMDACAALILSLAGGTALGGRASAGSKGKAPDAVDLKPEQVNALLGTSLSGDTMAALLKRRHFSVEAQGSGYRVSPPAWRRDVHAWVDLAEDVIQMAGLDSVPTTELAELRTPDPDDAWWRNAWLLRARLSALGLYEAGTYTYLDPALAKTWGLDAQAPRMDNPMSEDLSLLRPSLLPNLVAAALGALKRRQEGVALFELGRVFQKAKDGVRESERVAILLAGHASLGQWNEPARDWDFFDLKGMAESLGASLDLTFRSTASKPEELPAWAHPGRCSSISVGGLHGILAALHPALLVALEAPAGLEQIYVLELEYQNPSKTLAKEPHYAAFPRVPSVERDLSCLVDRGLEAGRILDFLKNEGGLGLARVLDRFEGAPLPEGRKSLTFRVTYAAEERTLTDEEVNRRHDDVIKRLETALPVEVRR